MKAQLQDDIPKHTDDVGNNVHGVCSWHRVKSAQPRIQEKRVHRWNENLGAS